MENKISVINVKLQNRVAVFNAIRSSGALSRTEIAEQSGISLGTAATLLGELENQQVIIQENENRKAVGRKPKRILFTPQMKKIITFDLASKSFRFNLLNLKLKEYATYQHSYDQEKTYQENLEMFLTSTQGIVQQTCLDQREIIGVGISAPGTYDSLSDNITNAPFEDIQQVSIRRTFSTYFDHPIFVDHDVFLALQSEVKEIEQKSQNSIFYLHLGEGIGGALWSGTHIHRGAREDAGDIGQILITPDTTLEQKISWNNLRTLFRQKSNVTDVFIGDQYQSGQTELSSAVAENTAIIADIISKIFWITDPHTLIISGHYTYLGEPFLTLLRKSVSAKLSSISHDGPNILFAQNPFKASSFGAAEMVIQEWLKSF